MRLRSICDSTITPDVKIYHKAIIDPESFIGKGISTSDAQDFGLITPPFTDDDHNEDDIDPDYRRPDLHPMLVDMILELPDKAWLEALNDGVELLSPNFKIDNIQIIDRGFDGHSLLTLQYVADVNFDAFLDSVDWDEEDARAAEHKGDFKIIKRL